MDIPLFQIEELFQIDVPSVLILGRRGTGKSSFIDLVLKISLFREKVEYKNILCVLGSEDETLSHYKRILYAEGFNEILFNFIHANDEPKIVVLDDVTHEHKALRYYTKALEEVYCNGRHNNTIVIMVAHSQSLLTPTVRANTDFFVICCPLSEDFLKSLGKEMRKSIKQKFLELNEVVPVGNRRDGLFRKLILQVSTDEFYWF